MNGADYDECKAAFIDLSKKYENSNRNEAITRLAFINDFISCLGWDVTKDCVAEDLIQEDVHSKQYADYVLMCPQRSLVIEAKREGNLFELPVGKGKREYKLKNLCDDVEHLKEAIVQVTKYAQDRGIPLVAVSNGHQLVAFVAIRMDGVAPKDGKALVFKSLDHMVEDFARLWNALSKESVQQQLLYKTLTGKNAKPMPTKLAKLLHRYPDVKKRDVYQANLQILSELIIEDLASAKSLETEFLTECYCQSGALSQYALISREILKARYAALFDVAEGAKPPVVQAAKNKKGVSSELLAESLSRRPILLVGDVGAGKTEFIRYLIKVSAVDEFKKAISLYIDLGSKAIITKSVAEAVLDLLPEEIEANCQVNIEDNAFVSSVYYLDLAHFDKKSIYAQLQGVNDTLFVEKRIDFLSAKIADKKGHLKRSLDYISKNQSKQVIVFIDNVDQRDYDVQQAAFLVAQEMAANWSVTVYIALRPESYNRSLNEGALSGYHPKAFSIAPPRIDEVIVKRLKFARKMTTGKIKIPALSPGIDLGTFDTALRAFIETIERNSEIPECIDNISGGNVRKALDFILDFFGSGHVELQRIVDSYMKGIQINISLREFMRAIIYGDAKFYDPDKSPIANIFDVVTLDRKEHFLVPLMIASLELIASRITTGDIGFVPTIQIYDTLQSMGFSPFQIEAAIRRSVKSRLLEVPGRTPLLEKSPIPELVRITSVAAYHTKRLPMYFEYLDAVVIDTPIVDFDFSLTILNVEDLDQKLVRVKRFLSYLNDSFVELINHRNIYDWPTLSAEALKRVDSIVQRI